MQYSIVAILALAGAAVATPQVYGSSSSSSAAAMSTSKSSAAAAMTVTTYSTQIVTLTECPETVTNCPARTSTNVSPVVVTYPAGAAYPTGTGYVKPTLTGYSGPAYTGAAGQVKVAGALAGVGAFAALLL